MARILNSNSINSGVEVVEPSLSVFLDMGWTWFFILLLLTDVSFLCMWYICCCCFLCFFPASFEFNFIFFNLFVKYLILLSNDLFLASHVLYCICSVTAKLFWPVCIKCLWTLPHLSQGASCEFPQVYRFWRWNIRWGASILGLTNNGTLPILLLRLVLSLFWIDCCLNFFSQGALPP